ncbi:hypothetical protein [Mycolicibacterium sp. HK-90]|uniref:hypothetical protein n=1 Tax=Mycolicibacterium sp. HK-90 TaxID=3056937 RepID=UPI00265AC9D6|nr:hypothetical protein [Mycolicibacterium sp. HK-90]WKG03470.1 hypothetical protein QU592_30605 [Mycolicibacterium sp. HK-90]
MRACTSALLDQLRPGSILLTVPLVDDVVQVGIGGDYPTATVAVSVTASAVRVRRLDGRPLQVHIVENWRDPASPGVATPVFDEPVDVVVLERCDGRWTADHRLRVVQTANLDGFVGTLARFAAAKQERVDQAVGAA